MRINNNLMALNTHRQLGIGSNGAAKSMEKLSSGLRINRAGDDAAGLAISEKMRAQIKGLNQASRNSQDGISLIQTAEGALQETHTILQRMRELTVQSNNGTNTADDLTEIQKEITELSSEITRVGEKTEFNGKALLTGSLGVKTADGTNNTVADYTAAGITFDMSGVASGETLTFTLTANAAGTADTLQVTGTNSGISQTISLGDDGGNGAIVAAGTTLNFDALGMKMSFSSNIDLDANLDGDGGTDGINGDDVKTAGTALSFQIGANANTTLDISIDDMRSANLGAAALNANVANLSAVDVTSKDYADNLEVIDEAIKEVSAQRSQLGAYQNRLEHTIKNLDTSSENLQAAESRIRDVDMAQEMMEYTKNNILQQAAQAMLAQANQAPQGVLQLLR